MLVAVSSYDSESAADDQSRSSHGSIFVLVSDSDLVSLTSDFVRTMYIQNLSLRTPEKYRQLLDTVTRKVKAYKRRKGTILLQGITAPTAAEIRAKNGSNRLIALQCP